MDCPMCGCVLMADGGPDVTGQTDRSSGKCPNLDCSVVSATVRWERE